MSDYAPSHALYLLPCDHRSILLGTYAATISGDPAAGDAWVRAAKDVVVDGLLTAVAAGVPVGSTGLLMDDEYGAAAAHRAQVAGVPLFLPVDIGELGPWALQYGDRFVDHIEAMRPAAVAALVEYNPGSPDAPDQIARLQPLLSWLETSSHPFLLELQVTPTDGQLATTGGDRAAWNRVERPAFIVQAIKDLKRAGARPVIWKIEACHTLDDYTSVVAEVRAGGQDHARLVVLGAGASIEDVDQWLRLAAGEPACIGFAVGRTVWNDAITGWASGSLSREAATAQIASIYGHFVQTFGAARSEHGLGQ